MLKPATTESGKKKVVVETFLPGDFEITAAEGGEIARAEFVTRCRRGSALYFPPRGLHEKTGWGWRISNRYCRATSHYDTGREFRRTRPRRQCPSGHIFRAA